MKKMIRWIGSILLCAVLALSLGACKNQNWVMDIGGGRIPGGLYAYSLDRSYSDAKKQIGENKNITKSSIEGVSGKEWVLARAQQYLREFVAVNSHFKEEGLTLTPAQKGEISAAVGAQWSTSSAHYLSLGIDKTVLTQVQENKAKRDRLFSEYYDTGGREAVPEEELKTWFQENYVGFIAINGYLTTEDVAGNTVPLNSEQVKKLRETFEQMAGSINSGTAIGDAAATSEATKNQELRESVIYKTGSGYPQGFYDEVKAIPQNQAKVIVKDDFIYVVKRIDVMGAEGALYNANRNAVLRESRGADFNKKVAEWGKAYSLRQKKVNTQYWYRRIAD